MKNNITYRNPNLTDVLKLSILYKAVYIQTYGVAGVSDEFANFISKQFSVERLSQIITESPERIVVADYQTNLLGVAEVEWNKQCPVGNLIAPELNKLYILERFCGQGIGNRLLEEAEKIVKAKGINQIWLWVLDSNEKAISFYKKQHYQEIGDASFQMEVNRYENKVMLKHWAGADLG